jgi:hypothetical protein
VIIILFFIGIQRVVLKDDSSVVTVRPKQYVGSSGSVWASEHVYLRWNHPQLYEVHGQTLNPALRTFSAMARDNLFYFLDTTEKGDVECVAEDPLCKFRSYEKCRIEHVLSSLIDAQSLWKVSKDKVEAKEIALGNEIVDSLLEATKELQNLRDILVSTTTTTGEDLWSSYEICITKIKNVTIDMKLHCLPGPHRPRLLVQTDKGPGISITNFEVKFRDAELARLFNLDWQMRIHLAVNDPCPAERTNACIGEVPSRFF